MQTQRTVATTPAVGSEPLTSHAVAVPDDLADVIDFPAPKAAPPQRKIDAATFAANVPAELRELRRWLAYGPDPETGRGKTPLMISSRARRASTRRSDTWTTWERSCQFRAKYGSEPGVGVGFVFTTSDDFVYADLDGALDAAGGLREWATPYVEPFLAAGCYAERSPGGRGLHLIGKGKLPEGVGAGGKVNLPQHASPDFTSTDPKTRERRPRIPEVAIFSSGKYSTITGARISAGGPLGDCTAAAAHVWALAGIQATGIDAVAGEAPADDELPKVDLRRVPRSVREELKAITAAGADDRSAARFRLYVDAAQTLEPEEIFAIVLAHDEWFHASGAADKGRAATWTDIIRCSMKADTARRDFETAKEDAEEEASSRDREIVEWNPLDFSGMLPAIERAMIKRGLLRIDRAYVRIIEDEIPGTTHVDNDRRPEQERLPAPKQIACVPMRSTDMLLAIERAVTLCKRTEKGLKPIPVPLKPSLPAMMLDLPDKSAPQVRGLVQHPIVTPDGRLINREGYDTATGLHLAFGGWRFSAVPEHPTKDDAVRAAQRIRDLVLCEVLLRDEKIDGAALLAAYLTGVARKVLPQAPAVLINATVQGTGKTTVARMLHAVLTGRDMAVQSMSPDANEFQKQALAFLLRQPAMATFDNVPDGSTIDNDQIARLVTNPYFEGRYLGASQTVTVPTNTLWVFTGNSIAVGSDLVRRFLEIDLLAREARPEQRRFTHPDPVRRAQEIRSGVISAVLTIQRAWHAAGQPAEGPSLGLGVEVDRLVTWPLAYAAEEGIFQKRDELSERSPEEQAKTATLLALRDRFGDQEFTAAEIVQKIGGTSEFVEEGNRPLREAIEASDRKRVFNAQPLGKYLGTLVDQPPREGLTLRSRLQRGRVLYGVAQASP